MAAQSNVQVEVNTLPSPSKVGSNVPSCAEEMEGIKRQIMNTQTATNVDKAFIILVSEFIVLTPHFKMGE